MSKVQIHGKSGGGGNSLGLQKLWEGDVHLTGSTDDLTGGAVDPSEYFLLIVHCTGTIASQNGTVAIGVGSSSNASGSYSHDITVSQKTSGEAEAVSITMLYRKNNSTESNFWYGTHTRAYSDKEHFSTQIPFSLKGSGSNGYEKNTFTGDLHVAVYGIKL